jgi:hypothetical protein
MLEVKATYDLAICCDGGGRSAQAHRKSENERYNFRLRGLKALPIQTLETCAEWLHLHIREDWGFPRPAGYDHGTETCVNCSAFWGIWLG